MTTRWRTSDGRLEMVDEGKGLPSVKVDNTEVSIPQVVFNGLMAHLNDQLQPVLPPVDPDAELAAKMMDGAFLYHPDRKCKLYCSYSSSSLDTAHNILAAAFKHVRQEGEAAGVKRERARCVELIERRSMSLWTGHREAESDSLKQLAADLSK